MSLAASGGMAGAGGAHGGGGVMMAHNVNGNAVQNLAQQHAQQAPPQAHASASGGGGPSQWIGHDIMDKQQKSLSLSKIKSVSHLPLTALDLYAGQPMVAFFPPRSEDTVNTSDRPHLVGKMKAHVAFKGSETAHKVVRKWLTQAKPFSALKADGVLTTDKDKEAVILDQPYRWLGMRRLEQAPEAYRSDPNVLWDEDNSHAIAEESSQVGGLWQNGTLDGKSNPVGDDFDRVVCRLRLVATKKALTLLPEEATQVLLHQAQYHVAGQTKVAVADEICQMPLAVAVPAYAMHDGAMEALMDACQAVPGGTGTILPRALCAVAGALSLDRRSVKATSEILQRVQKVREHRQKTFRAEHPDPSEHLEDVQQWILLGSTPDGLEATAVVFGEFQGNRQPTCPIGSIQIQSNVAYQSKDPLSLCTDAVQQLHASLERMTLEEGPAGIVVYGADQDAVVKAWNEATKKLGDDDWKTLPLFKAPPESVAVGAALLGAISHGRLAIESSSSSSKKSKLDLAIRTQWVAPVAVGMAFHYKYQGKTKTGWTPVKEVFGFDRRVPAGPHVVECKAADCVVYREGKVSHDDDEAFLKASKDAEGAKNIPEREKAALAFRVQIYQKWTRDGEWIPLGDPLEPLVALSKNENRIACEAVNLEISLAATGMVSTMLVGDRASVKQATKTARWNYIQNAIAIALAVLFFGGFFVKSWWDEYVLNRDTRRLLAYYKHVVPDSIHDGDEGTARWLVYKYSGKKDKLWESLEKKYGVPVPLAHEWADMKASGEEEPEVITFDDDDEKQGDTVSSSAEGDKSSQDEPDL